MKIALHLVGAVCWLSFAFGLLEPEWWLVYVAYFFCGVDSLLAGIKEWESQNAAT